MDKKLRNKIIIASVIILLVVLVSWWWENKQPGKLDAFAQCISEKGAKFYGAFWCPHCQTQKKMFGNSEKYLPYVECSTPDSRGQLKACADEKITGYPTWKFADGSVETGELSLQKLSEKTSCPLP